MNSRWLVIGIFGLVLALGGVLQELNEFRKPFKLNEFVSFLDEQGHFREPPPVFQEEFVEQQIGNGTFNENYFLSTDDIRIRVLIVDAASVLESWRTPLSYREYVAQNVLNSGVAFPCFQFMILDGSILDRPVKEFASRISGVPARFLTNISGTPNDYFLFLFFHELTHLTDFHFSLPTEKERNRRSFLQTAGNAMKKGAYSDAIDAYQTALELCPADFRALDHMAIAHRRGNNHDAAEAAYLKSLEINPKNEVAARNIMIGYLLDSDFDAVIKQASENKENFEQNGEDAYFLGRAYLGKGNLEAGYKLLGEARNQYPSGSVSKALEATLIRLSLLKKDPKIGDIVTETRIFANLCRKPQLPSTLKQYCPLNP